MVEANDTDWKAKYEILQAAKSHNDAYLEKCINELRLIRPLNLRYYRAIENAVNLLKTPGNDDLVQGLLQDVLIDADQLARELKGGILSLNAECKDKT